MKLDGGFAGPSSPGSCFTGYFSPYSASASSGMGFPAFSPVFTPVNLQPARCHHQHGCLRLQMALFRQEALLRLFASNNYLNSAVAYA